MRDSLLIKSRPVALHALTEILLTLPENPSLFPGVDGDFDGSRLVISLAGADYPDRQFGKREYGLIFTKERWNPYVSPGFQALFHVLSLTPDGWTAKGTPLKPASTTSELYELLVYLCKIASAALALGASEPLPVWMPRIQEPLGQVPLSATRAAGLLSQSHQSSNQISLGKRAELSPRHEKFLRKLIEEIDDK